MKPNVSNVQFLKQLDREVSLLLPSWHVPFVDELSDIVWVVDFRSEPFVDYDKSNGLSNEIDLVVDVRRF